MADQYPLRWVMLNRYCELSGDTAAAVNARKRAGIWLQDLHYTSRGGRIWINLDEVQRWVESGATCPLVSVSGRKAGISA